MASDQSMALGSRALKGGGPQLELLRRLAHWMMKEPDLEEEALTAEPTGQTMRIIRRTIGTEIGDVTVTHPDGTETDLALNEVSPGRFETLWDAPEVGLYRLREGDVESVIALGPQHRASLSKPLQRRDRAACRRQHPWWHSQHL